MREAEGVARTNTCLESGLQMRSAAGKEREVIKRGSRFNRPRGDSERSSVYSSDRVLVGRRKATLVPSGERVGAAAVVVVMALREGTDGKRVAAARVTTSFSMERDLDQGWKPSFLTSIL